MKKIKFFLLPFIFALVVTSCDKENDSVINTVTQEVSVNDNVSTTNAYEQLTTQYLAAVEKNTTPPDLTAPLSFWGKLWKGVKQFLNADGNAMLDGYLESRDFFGSLGGGIAASIKDVTKELTIEVDGLPDLAVLEGVGYVENKFDLIGFNHYVVVNNILNDIGKYKTISDEEELNEAIIKRVNLEVAMLYPDEKISNDLDYMALYESVKLQPGESYTEGSAYYDRMFSSKGKMTNPAFAQILQLYARSYEAVKEGYIDSFVAYSKTMEEAVIKDKNLADDIKETLLIGMATYRYGIKYYSNLN